jgi:hypothetical protein
MQLMEENGTTQVLDPSIKTLTVSYVDYSYTFPTMPNGAAWTLAEVNAWTTRFGVQNNTGTSARVDRVYVVVGYTLPPACQLGVDLSWNAGTTWSSEKTQTLSTTNTSYLLGTPSDKWGTHTWVPTDFSNANFRARVHAINPGGSCTASAIDHLDQLLVKVHYTQTTDPIQAALNAADAAKIASTNIFAIYFGTGNPDLLAQLATGVTPVSGHQPGSFNDPNGVTNSSVTSAPTANSTPNQFTNSNRGFASDNLYTTDTVNGHQQGYKNFSLAIPPGATISGVELDVEAKSTDSTGCQIGAALSVDGGSTYPYTIANVGITSTSDLIYKFGNATSLWGNTWTIDQLGAAKFAVRIQDIDPGTQCTNGSTLSVDQVVAKVYYSVNTENGDGDNFFISPTAADMKGIFQFIGNQVCPAASNPAQTPPPTQGGILVVTQVINNEPVNEGTATPADFSMSMIGTNVSPAGALSGSATGIVVTVNPGSYSLLATAKDGYTQSLTPTCSSASNGNIAAGEARVCIVTYDDIPPPPPPPNFNLTPGTWQETPTAQP